MTPLAWRPGAPAAPLDEHRKLLPSLFQSICEGGEKVWSALASLLLEECGRSAVQVTELIMSAFSNLRRIKPPIQKDAL